MENHFNPNSKWRKIAAAIYKKPVDSRIFGTVDLDVTDLEAYVLEKRRQGLKITLMHPLILIVSRTFREEVPALNCYVQRGNVILRKQVDAMVSVLQQGDQMGSARVPNADQMSISELAEFLGQEVIRSRNGQEHKTMELKDVLVALPWPFRGWLAGLFRWVAVDIGLSIPALGLSPDSFGSFIFSNIGSLGLEVGYAALMPPANVSMVFTMGSVQTKAVVVDDQIQARRMLTVSAVFDHRIVDASHIGRLFTCLKRGIKVPEKLDSKPVKAAV